MALADERILAFEVRRAAETRILLAKQGAENVDFVCTFVEAPLEANSEAFAFGRELLAGIHPLVLCMTGVAVRRLFEILRSQHDAADLTAALARTVTVCRGPKPSAALRELGLPPTVVIGEPATYHEVLDALRARPERSLAIIEYGRPSEPLLEGLAAQGRAVRRVPVYQYELPADVAPIDRAIEAILAGQYSLLIFTSSIQFTNLLEAARRQQRDTALLDALQKARVASIGKTLSETLREHGIEPAFEPSHPKLGVMIQELAATPR